MLVLLSTLLLFLPSRFLFPLLPSFSLLETVFIEILLLETFLLIKMKMERCWQKLLTLDCQGELIHNDEAPFSIVRQLFGAKCSLADHLIRENIIVCVGMELTYIVSSCFLA